MKSKTSSALRALALFLVVGAVAPALAHSGATGVVKTRMHVMDTINKAMKSLSAAVQRPGHQDAKTIRTAAGTIRDHAGKSMTKLFPANSTGYPSEAKPEIWTDWKTFSGLAERLHKLGNDMAQTAGERGENAADRRKALFVSMRETCTTCHEAFRLNEN